MSSLEISQYTCNDKMNIVDAMKKIDKNSGGLLYVLNDESELVGCLTDGDIRRWIIAGGNLSATAHDAMNGQPKYVYQENLGECYKKMTEEQISSIALVNDKKQIIDIVFHESYIKLRGKKNKNSLKGTAIIIMAGGKGSRLYPYTKILPKPLIPIGDIPILERILDRFFEYGADEFYLTVNYKREIIKSYFAETVHPYRLLYIDEDEPMGTAGSISLIDKEFQRPVIITNCDILIITDYEEILNYHKKSLNDLTIISSLKRTIIPYGVLQIKEHGLVASMEEKPQISHFINTGMYVINPEFLSWIPKGKVFHMTDLAQLMIDNGCQVGVYPISENSFWDMGEFEEMKKMEERINASNNE